MVYKIINNPKTPYEHVNRAVLYIEKPIYIKPGSTADYMLKTYTEWIHPQGFIKIVITSLYIKSVISHTSLRAQLLEIVVGDIHGEGLPNKY